MGIDRDMAAFAVASIEQWWKRVGRKRYGGARRLLITGDIGSIRTSEGLEVHAWLDDRDYPKECKVSDEELQEVHIHRNPFQGDWNYEIHPRVRR